MNEWMLEYEGFDPDQEKLRETLCTLGNGYFATRGAGSESQADGVHYPGTYLAGGYDRLVSTVAGREVENEDLVNLPNWLPLSFRAEGGEWFDLGSCELLDYRQTLDLRRGVLHRTMRYADREGRVTRVAERRLVHMRHPHQAAIEVEITPEWSGRLEVRSAIDGRVTNAGVDRYSDLHQQHLGPLTTSAVGDDTVVVEVATVQSALRVVEAARTRAYRRGQRIAAETRTVQGAGYAGCHLAFAVRADETVTVEKLVTLYTSRDGGISECGLAAREEAARLGRFAELLDDQAAAWAALWRRFDLELEAIDDDGPDERTAMILHLYLFHLLQTTSVLTMKMALDVGVPSRGWTGEAYRGHIFWDEIFILPILNFRLPEITRTLLMYRYRRLGAARGMALAAGYEGAMYPWQSGSDGREESQQLHLNPKSGRWIPDNSRLQRHVNAAIAYNIDHYVEVTGDTEFMIFYGAEMFLQIARFLASLATWNDELERYEILGVMGPDEYHDSYPGADRPGLDNNAYTNVMTAWVLDRALTMLASLPEDRREELVAHLGLRDEETQRWREVSRRLRVVFHGDGIISQFEGYDELAEFDWKGYREKYDDIQRLDRVLEAEDDTPNRYKASKQADVLMLFYLFSAEELERLFKQLGYPFHSDTIPKNIEYYQARTSHGSTLSRVVHSWVLARADREASWRLFEEALESDISDIQGGTTPEGIHLGAMAGVADLVQRCYTGLEPREDVLYFNPTLPQELAQLALRIRYRGHTLGVNLTSKAMTVKALQSSESPIAVCIAGTSFELAAGEERTVRLGS